MEAVLRLLWSLGATDEFVSDNGSVVKVFTRGSFDYATHSFRAAEIEIGEVRYRGDVVFGAHPDADTLRYAVLHIVSTPTHTIFNSQSEPITQIIMPVPSELAQKVDSLHRGAAYYECGNWLADTDPIVRVKILDDLLMERLRRKCGDINRILDASDGNWGQTFYVMFFRTMGGNRNREPYMKLAERATYRMTLSERANPEMVEALLLGTSGLLEGCYYDEYIHQLREHFKYLANKYRITPMQSGEWERAGMNPANSPVIRIVQLAGFVANHDFVFDTMLACRTREDVHRLFDAEVSDYWAEHYQPDVKTGYSVKRIGEAKADLLAINLVVPMMIAYATAVKKETLKEAALSLLEQIPAENNLIIRSWTGAGVPAVNALDSQALLQLRTEYCDKGLCTQCRVGRRILRSAIK